MAIEVVAATRGAENRGGAVKGDVDAGLGQPLQIACDGIPDNEVDAVEARVKEDPPMAATERSPSGAIERRLGDGGC